MLIELKPISLFFVVVPTEFPVAPEFNRGELFVFPNSFTHLFFILNTLGMPFIKPVSEQFHFFDLAFVEHAIEHFLFPLLDNVFQRTVFGVLLLENGLVLVSLDEELLDFTIVVLPLLVFFEFLLGILWCALGLQTLVSVLYFVVLLA